VLFCVCAALGPGSSPLRASYRTTFPQERDITHPHRRGRVFGRSRHAVPVSKQHCASACASACRLVRHDARDRLFPCCDPPPYVRRGPRQIFFFPLPPRSNCLISQIQGDGGGAGGDSGPRRNLACVTMGARPCCWAASPPLIAVGALRRIKSVWPARTNRGVSLTPTDFVDEERDEMRTLSIPARPGRVEAFDRPPHSASRRLHGFVLPAGPVSSSLPFLSFADFLLSSARRIRHAASISVFLPFYATTDVRGG